MRFPFFTIGGQAEKACKARRIRVYFLFTVFLAAALAFPRPSTASEDQSADAVKRTPTFHQKVKGFTLTLSTDEMGYLLDDLPYAAHLLTEYKIYTLSIERRGDVYYAEDRKGLQGTFRLVEVNRLFREYRGQGSFTNEIIGVVTADVAATIKYTPVHPTLLTNDLEFWVLVNNPVLDLLCRVFRPLLKGILKNNVEFLVSTTQKLAETIRAEEVKMPHE